MNLREQILNAKDHKEVKIVVKEWDNVEITLKTWNSMQRARIVALGDNPDAAAHAVVMSCYDSGGNLIFKPEDVKQLATKNSAVVEFVCQHLIELNAIGKSEEAKNS